MNPSAVAVVGPKLGLFGGLTILATCTGLPLSPPKEVTTAVKLPRTAGAVVKFTVNEVDVAFVTAPTAPLLKATVLLAAIESNPVPVIVRVVAVEDRFAVFKVTVGALLMFATCTAVPLDPPKEVTTAVRLPREGAVSKVTVNWVEVAEVTWPVPLLKLTVFILGVGTKFVPVIVSVVALIASPSVLRFTVGVETATVGMLFNENGLVQPVAPCR